MSRREEKERLRQERIAAARSASSSDRRRLMLGYVLAGILGAAVVAGLGVAIFSGGDTPDSVGDFKTCANGHFQADAGTLLQDNEADCREGTPPAPIAVGDLEESARIANCELELELPNEGNTHIEEGDETPKYESNPPTSGDHVIPPLQAADGAYKDPPDQKYVVHSLEHGRINYQYDPELPEDQQLAIKGVFDDNPDGTLFFPNPDMPYAVAASAWQNYVGCKEFTPAALDVLRNFRDTFRGKGPESGVFPVSF
jgi:hypothetical protein